MLENEPEGGERTGSQPAGETADDSTTAVGSAPVGPQDAAGAESVEPAAPVRRTRTTRRRAAPLNQPEQTDAPVEATTGGAGSVESPQAEVFAPVSGDLDVAPKTPRRRRKATPVETTADEPLVAASAEAASAEVVPPVKVTRTRRKKATPAAVEEPPATEQPPAAEEPLATEEPVVAEEPAESDLREAEAELDDTETLPSATAAELAWTSGAQDRSGEVPRVWRFPVSATSRTSPPRSSRSSRVPVVGGLPSPRPPYCSWRPSRMPCR